MWLFVTLKTGASGMITVESLENALLDPPPDTPAWFTCGEDALAATSTVTMIGG